MTRGPHSASVTPLNKFLYIPRYTFTYVCIIYIQKFSTTHVNNTCLSIYIYNIYIYLLGFNFFNINAHDAMLTHFKCNAP